MKKKERTFKDKIKLSFQHTLMMEIFINVLFLGFGVIIYLNPMLFIKVEGLLLGIFLLLLGLFDIYEYFVRGTLGFFNNKLFKGLLGIFAGLFVIFNPFKIVKILTFALGIYLVSEGIFRGLEAWNLKKREVEIANLLLVVSGLILLFGIFIMINPMAAMDIAMAAGIFIILSSILEITSLLLLYKKGKDIVKLWAK